jgi:hypothetical protein
MVLALPNVNMKAGIPALSKEKISGEELALSILSYLQKNPGAKDTLDGISQWWVTGRSAEGRVSEVATAIDLLLSKDLILETRREGLPPYYRLNQEKGDVVCRVLSQRHLF